MQSGGGRGPGRDVQLPRDLRLRPHRPGRGARPRPRGRLRVRRRAATSCEVTRDGRNLPAGGPDRDAARREVPLPHAAVGRAAGSGVTPQSDTRRQHQLVEVDRPERPLARVRLLRRRGPHPRRGRRPRPRRRRSPLHRALGARPRGRREARPRRRRSGPGSATTRRQAVALSQFRTTVRDARGKDTVYVLNGNGSPLRIEEPLGKTTTMTWAADDILKTSETDANGRLTQFEYDERGNLTLERVVTSDLGPVETALRATTRGSTSSPTRRTPKAVRRATRSIPRRATFSPRSTPSATAPRTRTTTTGRLLTVTDPRGHVDDATRDHDSFGNAGRGRPIPLGNVTTPHVRLARPARAADATAWAATRSRRRTGSTAWCGRRRVAGGGSDDEVIETEYYPGGEPRARPQRERRRDDLHARRPEAAWSATETRFDGQTLTTATTYDANGNKETETDRRGVTRRITYDDLNRLVAVEIAVGPAGRGADRPRSRPTPTTSSGNKTLRDGPRRPHDPLRATTASTA